MVRVSPPPGLCPLAVLSGSPGVNWTASGFAPHPTFDGNDPTSRRGWKPVFDLIDLGVTTPKEARPERLSDYLTNRSVVGCSIDCRAARPRQRASRGSDRPPAYQFLTMFK